jgi:hypothetical protein
MGYRHTEYFCSFEQADRYLGRKSDRPLPGRATRVQRRPDGSIAVRYQATDVVVHHPDGTATLNSDGYLTSTTKQRINDYSSARLSQTRGIWYVRGARADWSDQSLFYDGMRIGADGAPLEPRPAAETERIKREVDRKVAAFIRGWLAELRTSKVLPDPSNGDCWGCLFATGTATRDGKAIDFRDPRQQPMGIDHIVSHLVEGYYVPSLLWRAVQRRGVPAACWEMARMDIEAGRGAGLLADDLRWYLRTVKPAIVAEVQAHGWPKADASE